MSAKYLFIARELEQLLTRSAQKHRLPTEAELCSMYGCSRQTVRSALSVLEDKGLIVKRRGSGSYPTQATPAGNRRIALLLADREEYLSPGLLRDIRKAAQEADCTIECYETRGEYAREREILSQLLQHRPAGILLEPITDVLGCFNEDLLTRLQIAGVPVVCINGCYQAPTMLSVTADDSGGAEQLMTHLAVQGHRDVAMILKSDDSRGIARFRGIVRASGELGIRLKQECILWYSAQERLKLLDGDDALMTRFFREYRQSCTAVICFNDEIAFRLLRSMQGEKPLAVVSFDNSYLAVSREPAITSLGISEDSPGTAAVRLLLAQLEGRNPSSVTLPWRLHVRKSG